MGTEGDEYLAEGLTEELISQLSRAGAARVLTKAAVRPYKNSQKPIEQIGAELNAQTLIRGSIRHQGREIRVSVQLIDAKTQENLWSQDFDAKTSQIFAVQKAIASRVARRFNGRTLASVESREVLDDATNGSEAYPLYLKGRFFLRKRTEAGLRKGIQILEESLRLDPRLAPAWAALANAAGLQSFYGIIPPSESAQRTMQYAGKALQLDPLSTEALLSLAETQAYYQYDWDKASRTFLQAIESDPTHPTVRQWYSEFLAYQGKEEMAQAELKQAQHLDPTSLVVQLAGAHINYALHHFDTAYRYSSTAIEMDPTFAIAHYWHGLIELQRKNPEKAIAALEKASKLSAEAAQPLDMIEASRAYAYAVSGQTGKAEQILKHLNQLAATRYVSAYHFAKIYAGLGDHQKMAVALQKSLEEHSAQLPMLMREPIFEPYLHRSEFRNVLHSMGMPALAHQGM